jgi:hypothetical protein
MLLEYTGYSPTKPLYLKTSCIKLKFTDTKMSPLYNTAAVNHNRVGQAFDTNSTPRNIFDVQDSTYFHPRTSDESTGIHSRVRVRHFFTSTKLFHGNSPVQRVYVEKIHRKSLNKAVTA